jgi:SAM-dependent methyltransferase
MTQLHIGCGRTRLDGFVNIDVIDGCDLRLDMERDPLPCETGSVDLVFAHHSLEHFTNYLGALGEIWRVLRHGGRFLLEVPYYTLGQYNLVNPYHKTHFNEFSFDFFEIGKLKQSAHEENPILFTKAWHRFHWMAEFADKPEAEREFARRHYFNTVRAIDFSLYAVKPPHERIELPRQADSDIAAEFDDIVGRIQR